MDAVTLGVTSGLALVCSHVLVMLPMKFESRGRIGRPFQQLFEQLHDRINLFYLTFGLYPIISELILVISLTLLSAIISRDYGPIMLISAIGRLFSLDMSPK